MGDKHSTKKLLVTITLAVVLLMGAATTVVALRTHHQPKASSTRTAHQAKPAQPKQHATISYAGQEGKTALELLQQKATVVTKDSSYGPYVDSINGVSGGGKYWTFYVNGKEASVSAGAYISHSTDAIEWKFQ